MNRDPEKNAADQRRYMARQRERGFVLVNLYVPRHLAPLMSKISRRLLKTGGWLPSEWWEEFSTCVDDDVEELDEIEDE